MTPVALGIDIGTGSTKAALVDTAGNVVATGRAPHPVVARHPGWSETAPADWMQSVSTAVAAVMHAAQGIVVEAIGLSGHMHGVVVCDRTGAPLRDAVLWSDRRSQPDLDGLRPRLESILPRLGNPLVAGMAGPTLTALRRTEPELLAATRLVLQPKDWVRLQLTGTAATDPSDASATLLWDVVDDTWSAEACEVFGAEPSWLPPVFGSGADAGTLTASAARHMGLPAGLPVATGGADTAAALLGAGLTLGETQVTTGTAGQIATLLDRPVIDPTLRTHLFRAAQPDRWYAMAAMQNLGAAIQWASGVLGMDLSEATRAAAETPTGAHGVTFLPYVTGERTPHLDAGLTAQWSGLHQGTTSHDLIRAVFEGAACSMRDGLDALRSAGHHIETALLAGGGSTAPWWRRLLADILQLPLIPHDSHDASARGAGLLGWSATGQPIDPAAAVHREAPIEPGEFPADVVARFHAAAYR